MSAVNLVWITPDADKMVGYMARVSNPAAKQEDDASKLIAYLVAHEHWSPFQMVNACVEINTTRDIARQILRHRSFHFQEFSQRYAAVGQEQPVLRAARLQDVKNRQNSIEVEDGDLRKYAFEALQEQVWGQAYKAYETCLLNGIAKEQARALLPEGLTSTRMYMNGTLRDWIHYLRVRTGSGTQKEHQLVAQAIYEILKEHCREIFLGVEQGGIAYGVG